MSKSRPDIWLPLYVGDYLADTQHLSAEQHGAYLLLLMHQWKTGGLPSESGTLARIARVPEGAWSTAWNVLRRFFEQKEDGNLIQPRLERERTVWSAKKAASVAKARHAAEVKHQRERESHAPSTASSTPQALLGRCPSPSPKDLKDSRQNSNFDGEAAGKEEKRSANTVDREAVRRVFVYYLEKLGKSARQYELTEKRMNKGVAALTACRKRFGSGPGAEEALGAAVDGLLANKWLMGANPSGKKYTDWETYVVKDVETMEKRWEDGGFNADVHA